MKRVVGSVPVEGRMLEDLSDWLCASGDKESEQWAARINEVLKETLAKQEKKLTCAEVRAEERRLNEKIRKHKKSIASLWESCLHDERQEQRDYQSAQPYTRCLGCQSIVRKTRGGWMIVGMI